MRKRIKTEWIVVHTAATNIPGITADDIDLWHRKRGFKMIGYHYVIRDDGTLEPGRPEDRVGAHCLGLNGKSVGICCTGHGDFTDFTFEQEVALVKLCRELLEKYNLHWMHIIGHREVNRLIREKRLSTRYRTSKTCPGNLIDMDYLRSICRKM